MHSENTDLYTCQYDSDYELSYNIIYEYTTSSQLPSRSIIYNIMHYIYIYNDVKDTPTYYAY